LLTFFGSKCCIFFLGITSLTYKLSASCQIKKSSAVIGFFFFLTILQVVYMDFLDLGANAGQIDYSIPRMAHIRNEHFMLVHNADRNLLSRKSYGVLPVRFILNFSFLSSFNIFESSLELLGSVLWCLFQYVWNMVYTNYKHSFLYFFDFSL
jgi:hypothetical protein